MNNIKVVHVGEYVQGGVATYIKYLLSSEERIHNGNLNLDEYLILSKSKSYHDWPIAKDKIFYYDYKRKLNYIGKTIKRIRQLIKNIEPDIVYCHSTWAGVFVRIPLLFCRRRYYVIYNAHGWSFCREDSRVKKYLYAIIEKVLSWKTDIIINVSQNEYQNAIAYGISKGKMCVLYSGVKNKMINCYSNNVFDNNQLNVLFVGRFDKQKGIDILLPIFRKVNRTDLHLYIAGGSVLDDCNLNKEYGSDNITFLGWIDHDIVGKYYSACDVVIMPSRWEAFGLVAIEAMSYGKPVIVSNRGALPELVEEGKTGFIFDLNDENSLESVLNNLDKNQLFIMGREAEKVFEKQFTLNKMIDGTHQIFKRLCKK